MARLFCWSLIPTRASKQQTLTHCKGACPALSILHLGKGGEIHLKPGYGHQRAWLNIALASCTKYPSPSPQICPFSWQLVCTFLLHLFRKWSEMKSNFANLFFVVVVVVYSPMSPISSHGLLHAQGKWRGSMGISYTLQEREQGSEEVRLIPQGPSWGSGHLGACFRISFRVDVNSASLPGVDPSLWPLSTANRALPGRLCPASIRMKSSLWAMEATNVDTDENECSVRE